MTEIEKKLKKVGQVVFYAALALEMLYVILDKSEYILPYETWLFRLTFLMFAVKIICTKYTRREWVCIIGMGILGVISFVATDREEIIRMVAIVAAFKDVDIKKAVKVTFYETLAGSLIVAALALSGIYGTVSSTELFRGGGIEETRYCFGMGHPNAFHCMFFVVLTLGFYLYNEKLKWWHYVLVFLVNTGLFMLTDSRTGFLAVTGTVLLFALFRYIPMLGEKKALYIAGIAFLIVCIIITIITGLHGEEVSIIKFFNRKLNGRLQIGMVEGGVRTWTLFSEAGRENYFDMGWMRLFYWYGIIPAIVYLVTLCCTIRQCYLKKDVKAFLVLMLFIAYTVLEAHAISVYLGRNYMLLFMGAYWTGIVRKKEEDGGEKSAEYQSEILDDRNIQSAVD